MKCNHVLHSNLAFSSISGSALISVLIFSALGFVIVLGYLSAQVHLQRPSLEYPKKIKSLLDTRSAAWFGYSILQKELKNSLPNSSNYLSSALTGGLFDDKSMKDTIDDTIKIFFDRDINLPYDTNSKCRLSCLPNGTWMNIYSKRYGKNQNSCNLIISGAPIKKSDTIVYLHTQSNQLPIINMYGMVNSDDSSGYSKKNLKMEKYRDRIYLQYKKFYVKKLTEIQESMLDFKSKTIKSTFDLGLVEDTISGDLLIDGASSRIEWKENREVIIGGDLQITGNVEISNLVLVVLGDAKIWGKSKLSGVTIISGNRIFFGDEKVFCQVTFNGQAISFSDIEVCNGTEIVNKSTICQLSDSLLKKQFSPKRDSTNQDNSAKVHSIYIRDFSKINGTVVNCSKLHGIKIWKQAQVKGVVWSGSILSIDGSIDGIAIADKIVPADSAIGSLPGSIKKLETIDHYFLPVFCNPPVIVSWSENHEKK